MWNRWRSWRSFLLIYKKRKRQKLTGECLWLWVEWKEDLREWGRLAKKTEVSRKLVNREEESGDSGFSFRDSSQKLSKALTLMDSDFRVIPCNKCSSPGCLFTGLHLGSLHSSDTAANLSRSKIGKIQQPKNGLVLIDHCSKKFNETKAGWNLCRSEKVAIQQWVFFFLATFAKICCSTFEGRRKP